MMDIVLIPTTIITAVLPEILKEETQDAYLRSKMDLIAQNAEALKKGLAN